MPSKPAAGYQRWLIAAETEIAAIAHRLKASSRSVGAATLGDLCAELENACLAGTRESVVQRLSEFEAALNAVDTYVF